MSYLEFLIAEAMGLPSSDSKVAAAVHALDKAGVIDRRRVQTVELHRKIDALNRQGLSTSIIAVRLGMHRVSVAKIVRSNLCKK